MINDVNIRPGRSIFMARIRSVANSIRSWLYFSLRAPWVVRKGLVRIPWSVDLWSPNKDIEFSGRIQFGKGCIVNCDISFGDSVLIAPNVAFVGRDDHTYNVLGSTIWDSPRGDSYKTVVGNDVWFGYGVIVIAGVEIGRGSIIAAGSVVVKDVKPYSIVAGVPAKEVGRRFTDEQIKQHEVFIS